MPRTEAQPFRLTVRVATPISLNHPWVHLDSIVRHLVDDRTYGRDAALMWAPGEHGRRLDRMRAAGTDKYLSAIARRGAGKDWLPCASVSEFAPSDTPYGTLQYFKRFEPEGFPKGGKVALGSGHYRTWMLRTIYLPVETVTFYGSGLLGQLRDLLGDLDGIGNDVRIGWGEIADWTLEPWPEDWGITRDGVAMRPIPVRLCREWEDEAWLTWHAPYWDRARAERCVPPGARCVLA